jgi:hypothetical protein
MNNILNKAQSESYKPYALGIKTNFKTKKLASERFAQHFAVSKPITGNINNNRNTILRLLKR